MVGGIRTGGFAALLVVLAVVLSTAAVPPLSGHTPLEAVGPDSSPTLDGVDAEPEVIDDVERPQDVDSLEDGTGDGLVHEDFASLVDDNDALVEGLTETAGLLSLLFGAGGLDGAVGGDSAHEDDDTTEDDLREDQHGDEDSLDDDEPAEREPTESEQAAGEDADSADSEDADSADSEDADSADTEMAEEADDEEAATADDAASEDVETDREASDAEADTDSADGADERTGEDEGTDDDLAGSESDLDNGDDNDSTDDGAVDSETGAGGDETASLLDRLDLTTGGLLIGGLLAAGVGWVAYRTGRSLLGIVLSIPSLLFGAVTRFVFGVSAIVERAAQAIRAASSVLALPGLFAAAVVQSCRDLAASVRSLFDRGQPTVETDGLDELPSEREQIRAAWRSVVDAVGDRRYYRRTPGEIKRKAVDRGLPEAPVATLVGVFRDVEYGAKDPTERASSAVSAANELHEATDNTDVESPMGDNSDTSEEKR